MNVQKILPVAVLALSVVTLGQLGSARASAMDSMSASAAGNCSTADTAMMHGGMMPATASAMKPSGNVDKDYAAMVGMHMKAAIAMAKIEAKCGKTPSARAQAAKDLEQFQQMQANLSALLNSN